LQQEGYDIEKVKHLDRYTIEIECSDPGGSPTVAHVLNEGGEIPADPIEFLMGYREKVEDNLRLILFSLQGFSRYARQVALLNDVELRWVVLPITE
jgi:hypothetical protein